MADFVRRLERIRRRERIERVIPDRINPLEVLSRSQVLERYRFLLGMLYDALESATLRLSPLPPMISLLVTLQFSASGSHYILIGDFHGVSKSSVSRAVKRTTAAICGIRQMFIKFPRNEDARVIHKEFYNIARRLFNTGAVLDMFILVKKPEELELAIELFGEDTDHFLRVFLFSSSRRQFSYQEYINQKKVELPKYAEVPAKFILKGVVKVSFLIRYASVAMLVENKEFVTVPVDTIRSLYRLTISPNNWRKCAFATRNLT